MVCASALVCPSKKKRDEDESGNAGYKEREESGGYLAAKRVLAFKVYDGIDPIVVHARTVCLRETLRRIS